MECHVRRLPWPFVRPFSSRLLQRSPAPRGSLGQVGSRPCQAPQAPHLCPNKNSTGQLVRLPWDGRLLVQPCLPALASSPASSSSSDSVSGSVPESSDSAECVKKVVVVWVSHSRQGPSRLCACLPGAGLFSVRVGSEADAAPPAPAPPPAPPGAPASVRVGALGSAA